MAKKSTQTSAVSVRRTRKKRPGVHAKKGSSKIKTSKRYKKGYRGQGK